MGAEHPQVSTASVILPRRRRKPVDVACAGRACLPRVPPEQCVRRWCHTPHFAQIVQDPVLRSGVPPGGLDWCNFLYRSLTSIDSGKSSTPIAWSEGRPTMTWRRGQVFRVALCSTSGEASTEATSALGLYLRRCGASHWMHSSHPCGSSNARDARGVRSGRSPAIRVDALPPSNSYFASRRRKLPLARIVASSDLHDPLVSDISGKIRFHLLRGSACLNRGCPPMTSPTT